MGAIDSDASQMALNLSSFAKLLLGLLLFSGVSPESPGCIKFKPVGIFVSQQRDDFPPHQCADSNITTICVVPEAPAPWLALDLGRGAHVKVARVQIYNRGDGLGRGRLRNAEVRLTYELPTSGDQMYTGGQLLGTFNGPAKNGQIIKVEGPARTGRYVLIQMNNWGSLNLHEVEAFGVGETTLDFRSDTKSPTESFIPIAMIVLSALIALACLVFVTVKVERLKREFEKFEKLKREFDAAHGPKMETNPDNGLQHSEVEESAADLKESNNAYEYDSFNQK